MEKASTQHPTAGGGGACDQFFQTDGYDEVSDAVEILHTMTVSVSI